MADYSITAVTRRAVFSGSAGRGPYSFTFPVLAETDLAVYIDSTLKTRTTHWSASISTSNGTGSVTFDSSVAAPTSSNTITIVGARAIERTTDFVTAGDLLASSLNTELDSQTIFNQQVSEDAARAIKAPVFDPASIDMTLPAKSTRAGKVLTFDSSTGNPTTSIAATDVTTVAGISSQVTNLSGISSDISGVNAIASNVTTVAGKTSEITSVAAKASLLTADFVSDLNTLAVTDVINDLNTLATSDIVSDINTLATSDIVSDLNTIAVSDVISDLNTIAVSDVISDINTLGTSDIVSDLNQLATSDFVSDLNALEAIKANITSVAGVSSNVSTVAGIASNVTTVAGNNSNINTVAGNNSNISTVAGISGNVTSLADISSDVTSLASAISSTTNYAVTVASGTLYGGGSGNVFHIDGSGNPALTLTRGNTYVFDQSNSSNSGHPIAFRTSADASYTTGVTVTGTAGSSGAKVTFVVPSDAPASLKYYCTAHGNGMGNLITTVTSNINVVASNIGSVNEFGQRYRVGGSDPTSSLDAGDLAFNTSANALKYYNGSSWQAIVAGSLTDIAQDGSPQLGADLDVQTHGIVSTANRNIAITPNGSGKVVLDGLSMPTADGNSGEALVTNGSGVMSFSEVAGGGNYLGNDGEVGSDANDIIRVHSNTLTYSGTLTLASSENGIVAGPFSVAGSTVLDVQGTLVVL